MCPEHRSADEGIGPAGDLRRRGALRTVPRPRSKPFRDPAQAACDSPRRWTTTVVLLLLVLIPIAFNAIALFPELSLPVPNLNDDAVHFLLVQRASEAMAAGENPFDHWAPELELGFPQFFYYQHLPHLAVVLLHRLLLKRADLLTLFNLIRYLLLVGFPLTVYWSVRRLGFSVVASAVAAAGASLLSSNYRYGFEYDSYLWRGLGTYTQLWAMHLTFITLACLHRVLERGTGYVEAVIASSMMALSHLLYSYMMAVTALVLLFLGMTRMNARVRVARLAMTGALAAVITSYLWLPFLLNTAYLGVSPYLERWKYDSFGAGDILTWLANGDLLDYGRLPVLTLLLALGVASALAARSRPARLALVLFLVWLLLFFGRHTWGTLADLLPMHQALWFHRFSGGVSLAAILLIGLGGEWIWLQLAPLHERSHALAAGLILLALIIPALRERQSFYATNARWIERARNALHADEDARTILSALKALPPGRTYAGLRANWGNSVRFGDLRFYDLLTFHRIAAVSPPYQDLSLNADLIWHFDDHNPAHYNLFNVKYVVAPSGLAMPAFLRCAKETSRYVLCRAETSGYAQFVTVATQAAPDSQSSLFFQNRTWLLSGEPAAGRFIRHVYPSGRGRPEGRADAAPPPSSGRPACRDGGAISEERVLPGLFDLRVECQEASTLVLKVTFHPNWRVTIDGRQAQPFMLSPSFIGLEVPAGAHHVRAEYRSPTYKTALLLLGVCALLATVCFRRRFGRLDAVLSSRL